MEQLPENAILYADSSRGAYIPKYFAEALDRSAVTLDGMAPASIDECMELIGRGPDEEYYWGAWEDLLNHLIITHTATGKSFHLWQDGDLWLIPA